MLQLPPIPGNIFPPLFTNYSILLTAPNPTLLRSSNAVLDTPSAQFFQLPLTRTTVFIHSPFSSYATLHLLWTLNISIFHQSDTPPAPNSILQLANIPSVLHILLLYDAPSAPYSQLMHDNIVTYLVSGSLSSASPYVHLWSTVHPAYFWNRRRRCIFVDLLSCCLQRQTQWVNWHLDTSKS